MDRYAVMDMIGEGSFGRVFRGKDKQTGEIVALKLIPKVGHCDKDIQSLRSECKIQKELNHPNIVRMIDAFETDNEVISVAEFVPGELFRLFDQYKAETVGQRRLPEHRVREIAGDLVSALHYLHSNRVLHRDIKPQNILLDPSGKAKLCDFGFARNLGLNTMVLTSIKGTPLYMAPELIEEKPYDHTADIWSLGCIIYELMVGVPPFSTSSLFQLIKKIRYESVQWPTHLSSVARDWLQGTLEKDCRRRLSWPDLHTHPFVTDHVSVEGAGPVPGVPSSLPPLTNTLTASQELAKEMQRQEKAKLLPGGSQTLIKVAQKHEIQKQQLAAAQNAILSRKPSLYGKGAVDKRRFSDGSHLQPGVSPGGGGMLLGRHHASHMSRRMSEFGQQLSMLPHLAQAQYIAPVQPIQNNISRNYLAQASPSVYNFNQNVKTIKPHIAPQSYHYQPISSPSHQSSLLPLNNLTSQHAPSEVPKNLAPLPSHSVGPIPVQFTQTLQQTGLVMPEPKRNTHITGQLELRAVVDKLNTSEVDKDKLDEKNISVDSNETLTNDLNETMKLEKASILEAEDTLLENDEWCEFLDGQLEEMVDELEGDGHIDCVDNPNFLGMIIGPLKNKNTNRLVLTKVVNVLMLPLSSENKNNSSYQRLLTSYQDKNIINLLLMALRISTSNQNDSTDMDYHTESEIAWAKCMSLLCHLVHCEDTFVDAIDNLDCDSFLVLLASENSEIICSVLAFLSKIISVRKDVDSSFIQNITKEVTEELLLDETSNCILIKIFYLVGLTARNYKSCLGNRIKLTDLVSKLGSETNQKDLLHAVKFASHFLQFAG